MEFGPHHLVARQYGVKEAKAQFDLLRENFPHVKIEMPIAQVIHGDGTATNVTIWKKDTMPLVELLSYPLASRELKMQALESAMESLARTHAAGLIHGHPHTGNFAVRIEKDRNAKEEPMIKAKTSLIDYTKISAGKGRKWGIGEDIKYAVNRIADASRLLGEDFFYENDFVAASNARKKLARELREHYKKHYALWKKKK
ncbi:hypothetical protein HY993_02135 [Candidatus Micrarchaeota archaeon]|nr:hypothetical protein [Candidatus Micrarchaeota archaeon]